MKASWVSRCHAPTEAGSSDVARVRRADRARLMSGESLQLLFSNRFENISVFAPGWVQCLAWGAGDCQLQTEVANLPATSTTSLSQGLILRKSSRVQAERLLLDQMVMYSVIDAH